MANRKSAILIRVTTEERDQLKRNAHEAGMTVSDYVRHALVYSDDRAVRVIDTEPLRKAVFELNKHGANLNQLMRFLNTYGVDAFDAASAERVLISDHEAIEELRAALLSLQAEARRRGVHLTMAAKNGSIDDGNGTEDSSR